MKSTGKLIVFIFTFLALTASAYAQSPREQLNQMVQQLQQTPNDNALREKLIKLAQDVKPAPAVPPEAKRAFVMGGTYQKEAKSPEDFGLAVKAFQDASTAAPWWGDAYYNLSVALESAKRYDEAKSALTLYLLTKPKDAEQAQERLYAIDAKKVLAGRQQQDGAKAKQAAETASVLIVPGKSIGPIRLGMTADEVQRLLGSADRVGTTGTRVYKRPALAVSVRSVVTHVHALDERYATAEGVKIGISQVASDLKMGAPTTIFPSLHGTDDNGRCYFRDGGATWVWFDNGSNIANSITVVPDCTYR